MATVPNHSRSALLTKLHITEKQLSQMLLKISQFQRSDFIDDDEQDSYTGYKSIKHGTISNSRDIIQQKLTETKSF